MYRYYRNSVSVSEVSVSLSLVVSESVASEVGVSLMATRIMKGRLNYEDSLYCEKNTLLKEIYMEISEKKIGWNIVTREYRKEV